MPSPTPTLGDTVATPRVDVLGVVVSPDDPALADIEVKRPRLVRRDALLVYFPALKGIAWFPPEQLTVIQEEMGR